MALSEIERKKVEKAVGAYIDLHRPPPHIRPELDIDYRLTGHSVEIFEIRPMWRNPTEKMEQPVAKATFVRTQGIWKIFWMRADLKWHSYDVCPKVKDIEQFLVEVEKDQYGCFWG